MRLIGAMNYCKICFKEVKDITWFNLLNEKTCICNKCFSKMKPSIRVRRAEGFLHISFYEYNNYIKTLLYQYKGCKDIELRNVFLGKQSHVLNKIFSKYIIVPGPTYRKKKEHNDFNHVIEMYRCLNLPIYDCISKKKDIKQKNLSYEERHSISDNIFLEKSSCLKGKKILFVDDLFTTGSTAIACANLIKSAGAKKVIIITMGRVVFI